MRTERGPRNIKNNSDIAIAVGVLLTRNSSNESHMKRHHASIYRQENCFVLLINLNHHFSGRRKVIYVLVGQKFCRSPCRRTAISCLTSTTSKPPSSFFIFLTSKFCLMLPSKLLL
ncbi:hypothetical protein VIGAN_05158400 [Vigna angularis var. angularis]|uniref:Uncharacterized protein n=1 Tax=Vigna angularis var. angularis TaxID=157739 RepID=A0A0S3S5N4_PHAAN|nr:hypothetical protein VIGAN_05158400 [Vigna angularis var. angularis]